MSNIQQIDAANVQAAVANKQIDTDAANSLLLDLNKALESLLTSQDQDPSAEVKASVMKSLNSIGQRLKTVYEKNNALPQENIMIFFYFLGKLNQDEVTNAELQAFLGQVNNAFGAAESKNAESQFKQAAKQYYKATHRPWWEKAFGFIIKIALPVVLLVTGVVDPAMLVGFGVMMAMSISGATKDLGNDIAKGLEHIMPDHVAEVIGGVLSVAVNFALTLGAGAVASIETVGEEVGEDVAHSMKKAISEKYQVDLKRMISMGVMGGSAALATEAPQIATNLVDLLPVSEDVKKALTATLLIILELVAVVGTIAGGYGASLSEEGASTNVIKKGMKSAADKAGGFIDTYLPKVFDFFEKNSDRIMSIGRTAKHIATGALGTAQVGTGVYDGEKANAEQKLGKYLSELNETMTEESATATQTQSIVEYANQMMKGFEVMIREVGNLFEINNVAADYLAQ